MELNLKITKVKWIMISNKQKPVRQPIVNIKRLNLNKLETKWMMISKKNNQATIG